MFQGICLNPRQTLVRPPSDRSASAFRKDAESHKDSAITGRIDDHSAILNDDPLSQKYDVRKKILLLGAKTTNCTCNSFQSASLLKILKAQKLEKFRKGIPSELFLQ